MFESCANVKSAWLGARFGNHTSNQLSAEYRVLGTPRGGRRTVPILMPSSGCLGVPSRTIRMDTVIRPQESIQLIRPAKVMPPTDECENARAKSQRCGQLFLVNGCQLPTAVTALLNRR